VEEVLLFNKRFSDCRCMPSLRRYSPTLCDGAEMAIFLRKFCFLYFSEPSAAHFSHALHCNFVLRYIMCGSMVDIQSATTENGQGKKKKEERTRMLAISMSIPAWSISDRRNYESRERPTDVGVD